MYEKLVKPRAIKCPVGRLTFQHSEFGAGVDFSHAVGGCALIDGLVPVCAQWLYAENWARTVIKFNHLRKKDTHTHTPLNVFLSSRLKFTTNPQTDRISSKSGGSLNHLPLNIQPTTVWSYSPRTVTSIQGGYCVDGMGFIFSCVKNTCFYIWYFTARCRKPEFSMVCMGLEYLGHLKNTSTDDTVHLVYLG